MIKVNDFLLSKMRMNVIIFIKEFIWGAAITF